MTRLAVAVLGTAVLGAAAMALAAFAPAPAPMLMEPRSTGQFRLLATSSTASASALTAGRYTVTTFEAVSSVGSGGASNIIALGPVGDWNVRKRGVEIVFFGSGADNATGSYRLWQVKRGRVSLAAMQVNDLELAYLGSGTFTLSTAVGAGSATTVTTSERLADTVTWTQATSATSPKGVGDKLESVFASAAAGAYSPADNTPGRLWVPECGNGDLFLELWVGTATGVNAVIDAGS